MRVGSRLLAVFVLWVCAPAWAFADPSITSVEDNVAYAVAAICAPYALDNIDRAGLPIGHGFVQPDRHDGLLQPNPTGVRVGVAGFVHVTFSQKPGERSCDVQARGADPQVLRRVALDALARRPEGFAPAKSKYLPGSFATEDMLCSAPDSAHPTAFVMLSSPRPAERDKIAILFTLNNFERRGATCDHEGVRLNYRTLAAAPDAAPPSHPALPGACKLALADQAPDRGGGTVASFEDRETSLARIPEAEKRFGGQIDPDYRDGPRVVVELDSGGSEVFIASARMQLRPGDHVTLRGPARNPALACHYIPPLIVTQAGEN